VGGNVPAALEAAAAAVAAARSTSVHRMVAMERERRPGGEAVESGAGGKDGGWRSDWEQRDRRG